MRQTYCLSIDKGLSDWIKIGAALMVALCHFSGYALSTNGSNALLYKVLSYAGGYLGVAIFFFLSGYGLMESELKSHLGIRQFIQRRFLKIYLPVILVTLLWIGVYDLLRAHDNQLSIRAFDAIMGGVIR